MKKIKENQGKTGLLSVQLGAKALETNQKLIQDQYQGVFRMFQGARISSRISFVIFVFFLFWLGLVLRSAYLQILPNKKLSDLKHQLFQRTVTLKPRRGSIYDRYGRELAISIPSQSLFADPQRMTEPYYAAKKISKLLSLPHKKLLKKFLNKKRRFVWVKRHLSEKEVRKIKSWNLKGIHFIKEKKRFYTNQKSLSQVLGFTGMEGQGLEGIEKQYNDILKGESQKVLIQRDARGRPLFMDFSPFITRVSGFDIYLTIDSDLQFYLEKGLKEVIQESKAESAIALILSADTSEVLAMANVPNFNPNYPLKTKKTVLRNRAVTDIFEPGSTLKTFTVISALKKGKELFKTYSSHSGQLEIGKSVITEADTKKRFKAFLNMSEILTLSSNIGAAEIALDIGSKSLRKTLLQFGFGAKTGIDFPGEAKGLLRPLPWRPIETATIGFGHGFAGTALQIANAYVAIANGGILKKPFLVKQIRNPYTGEEKAFSDKTLRRVLTPEEARTLTLMLISATEEGGTGFKASVPGYFVAGKTGTAQKVDLENKGYKEGEYITSFAGFIPAHKPKFVIYLMVDGTKNNFYASSLVAPLFSQIASYSVRKSGLSPSFLTEENILLASEGLKQTASQKVKRQDLQQSERQKIKGDGIGSVVKRHIAFVDDSIPDLKGLSLREVLSTTQGLDFKFSIRGYGKLVRTIPLAGEPIPENKNITLIFD